MQHGVGLTPLPARPSLLGKHTIFSFPISSFKQKTYTIINYTLKLPSTQPSAADLDNARRLLEKERKPLHGIFTSYCPDTPRGRASGNRSSTSSSSSSSTSTSGGGGHSSSELDARPGKRDKSPAPSSGQSSSPFSPSLGLTLEFARAFVSEFGLLPRLLTRIQLGEVFASVLRGRNKGDMGEPSLDYESFECFLLELSLRIPYFGHASAGAKEGKCFSRLSQLLLWLQSSAGQRSIISRVRGGAVVSFRLDAHLAISPQKQPAQHQHQLGLKKTPPAFSLKS